MTTNTESDDAGGGRRGLRPQPSAALFEVLRDAYGLDAASSDAQDLGGSANLNLLVEGRWVARVYRPWVRRDRLEAINVVRQRLARGSIPCAEQRLTRDGETWTNLGNRLVEVERFVPCDAKMDDWGQVLAAMPLLGRIHTLLRPLNLGEAADKPEFANHVGPDEALAWVARACDRIRSWTPTTTEAELADKSLDLAERLAVAELRAGSRTLPHQLVHGDFWDNNVLFSGGRVALVADLDFMGSRTRIDDLALTLFFAGLSLAAEDAPADLLERLPTLVAAYEAGLGQHLTERERAALPLAIVRQPLWAAGRWLTVLDSEATARRLAGAVLPEVAWASAILQDVRRWQDALARPV
ncbi:MAG TPA: phosphotransferase [Caulobacteraceae bacterium]|nr:phosphotransferase [Caulobacteraceae bacterium]